MNNKAKFVFLLSQEDTNINNDLAACIHKWFCLRQTITQSITQYKLSRKALPNTNYHAKHYPIQTITQSITQYKLSRKALPNTNYHAKHYPIQTITTTQSITQYKLSRKALPNTNYHAKHYPIQTITQSITQ